MATTGKFAAEHAAAYDAVASKGAAAVFTKTNPTQSQTTNIVTAGTPTTVTGVALEIAGNLVKYTALGLTVVRTITLFFVPTTYGDRPLHGSTIEWADGRKFTIQLIEPFAPDGVMISANVICSQ